MRELTLNIYKIGRYTQNYYAQELKTLGVTMGQFPFIMGIAENDGISQEKLSGNIMISKSTTALIVRQLLDAGLITREIDEQDRRNFKLHATAKALELVPKIEAVIERCHQVITADLTPIEREIFAALLEKVRIRTELSLSSRQRRNLAGGEDDPDAESVRY